MLYGADYFTEEEWIKIDGLIHKGQYVFTQGPPQNILDEELLSFDESKEYKPSFNVKTEALDPFEMAKNETVQISEVRLPSPISDPSETSRSPSQARSVPPAEMSSDGGSAPSPQPTKDTAMLDLSEMTMPTPVVAVEDVKSAQPQVQIPSNGGLALGYTQQQLDEVKAFNAGLTKAGQKRPPKYTTAEEFYPSPAGSESETYSNDLPSEAETFPPSSSPNDDDIEKLTNEVNLLETATSEAPFTKPGNLPPPFSPPTGPSKMETLAEQFAKAHGQRPRVINDFYQPNNPGHRPKRPESRASVQSSKPANFKHATTIVRPKTTAPRLQVPAGTVLVAQSSAPATHPMAVDVIAGDQIKVLKHVSGIMHVGMNLRTNKHGQFSESIFKRDTARHWVESQQQIDTAARHHRAGSVNTTISARLDRVESMNAAEWDEAPVTRPKTVAPAPIRPAPLGLAGSRFAALSDSDSKSEASDQQGGMSGLTPEEVGRIVDQKV